MSPFRWWSCVLALVVLVACRRQESADEPVPAPPPAPEPADAEEVSPLERARRDVTDSMGRHFDVVTVLHGSLVTGDLAGARRSASYIAEHRDASYPEPWMEFILRMRAAAETTADAPDLQAAARGAGDLAGACGACHTGLDRGPQFADPGQPPGSEGTEQPMRRHLWGSKRMWEGIVAPSDDLWRRGAEAFSALPQCQKSFDGAHESAGRVAEIRKQVGELAVEARAARRPHERARVYGELLGTCGTCHLSGC